VLNTKKIDDLRKLKGLTIPELSDLLSINKGTYHNLRGSGDFRVSHLEKLAEIFKIDVREFFEGNRGNSQTANGDGITQAINGNIYKADCEKYKAENKQLKELLKAKDETIKSKEELIEILKNK